MSQNELHVPLSTVDSKEKGISNNQESLLEEKSKRLQSTKSDLTLLELIARNLIFRNLQISPIGNVKKFGIILIGVKHHIWSHRMTKSIFSLLKKANDNFSRQAAFYKVRRLVNANFANCADI